MRSKVNSGWPKAKGTRQFHVPGRRRDLFEIVTAQRIAAGEDDVGQRIAEIQHVIEDPHSSVVSSPGKGRAAWPWRGSDVPQIARQSELPIDDHGSRSWRNSVGEPNQSVADYQCARASPVLSACLLV